MDYKGGRKKGSTYVIGGKVGQGYWQCKPDFNSEVCFIYLYP